MLPNGVWRGWRRDKATREKRCDEGKKAKNKTIRSARLLYAVHCFSTSAQLRREALRALAASHPSNATGDIIMPAGGNVADDGSSLGCGPLWPCRRQHTGTFGTFWILFGSFAVVFVRRLEARVEMLLSQKLSIGWYWSRWRVHHDQPHTPTAPIRLFEHP